MNRLFWLLIGALGTAACDGPVTPPAGNKPAVVARVMEIRISGLGTSTVAAAARALPAEPAAAMIPAEKSDAVEIVAASGRVLAPLTVAEPARDGSLQLEPLSTSSFTVGSRPPGGSGYRFVSATYRVRNATEAGVPYATARNNLAFVAVNTPTTLAGTSISFLKRFDGSDAAVSAADIVPTGGAAFNRNTGLISASVPDVLQAYTEAEVAGIGAVAGVTSVVPYGFVASNPAKPGERSLPGSPGSSWDGLVTFAFRVPLATSATGDAFSISAQFLAIDDNQAWVTQSLEEQDSASVSAVLDRTTVLNASLRSLVGHQVSSMPADFICRLRTAGTDLAPSHFLSDTDGGAPHC